jgi:hypothetical protein
MPGSYRNIALLIFVMLSAAKTTLAQNIPLDSFFVPGATWTEAWKWSLYPRSSCLEFGATKAFYRVERDTIAAGKQYHVLSIGYGGEYYFASSDICGAGFYPSVPTYTPFARIRVDSNRVYFTQDDYLESRIHLLTLGQEYLLYDYNLSVGARVTPDSLFQNNMRAYSIDSVPLSDGRHIKKFADSTGKYWLWGIGSVNGLVPNGYWYLQIYGPGPNSEAEYTLCYDHPSFDYHFQHTDTILYSNLQNDCFDWSSLNLVGHQTASGDSLSLYPNPMRDYLTVELNGNATIDAITIRDVTGREAYHIEHPQSNQIYPVLPTGLYLLTVVSSDGVVFTRKIVRE